MLRIVSIFGLAFATLGGAVAGTIVPINLTTAPVYTGTCATTVGCTPTLAAATGTFENQLFSTIFPSSTLPPSSAAQTIGPTSFIVAQQSASPNNDIYVSSPTTNLDTSIQIDLGSCTGASPSTSCGLYDANNLYTMIQASGAFGFQGVTITLDGVGANGSTPITDIIDLTSGVDYRATSNAGTGAVTCTDANSVSPFTSCAGENSDTAALSGTDSNPGGTGGNTVTTYNNVLGLDQNSGHNFYMDVQQLGLGSNFAGGYLDSVEISNDSPSGGKAQIVLSGLTATETPEPGTVALFALGFGLIGFWKIRNGRANA